MDVKVEIVFYKNSSVQLYFHSTDIQQIDKSADLSLYKILNEKRILLGDIKIPLKDLKD
jgi:hypothetical protein